MTTFSDLVYQQRKRPGREPFWLIRRPSTYTKDGFYTIGKLKHYWRRDEIRLYLNGDEGITSNQVHDILLVMKSINKRATDTTHSK
jgi:hypothetical protein